MAAYTIVILVGLVVLGALIAWAGDVIGYRLGKKRASIWGLRPRATARLVGAIVGALLPLIGLIVAMALSPMARIALLELDQLTQQQETLKQTIEMQRKSAQKAREQAAQFRTQAEEAQERSLLLEGLVDKLDAESSRLKQDVGSLTKTRNDLQAKVGRLEKQYQKAQEQLVAAESELVAAQQELVTAQNELAATQEQLASAESEVAALEATNQELEAKEAKLKADIDGLKQQIPTLQRQVAKLRDEVAGTKEQLAESKQEMAEVRRELDFRLAQLKLRQQDLDDLEQQYELYRKRQVGIAESPVIYGAGDVLLRAIVSTDQTEEQLANTLFEMLPFASLAAERKGAVRGENGRATLLVVPLPPDITDHDPTETEIVLYLADLMKKRTAVDNFVVSVAAFRRFVVGEHGQLHVAMWAVPNVRIFVQDEVIAETVIEADSKPADIFTNIWYLLRYKVRQRAQQEGLLANPETGQYGAIDAGELFKLIEEIQEYDCDVKVQVMPIEDIYTADQLKIRFAVHRESATKSDE